MKTQRQQFRALGRDLFMDLKCECPNPRFADSSYGHLMKTSLLLTGYADDHFFDVANKEAREGACRCGRRYRVQWFRDGVEAEWIDPPVEEATS